MPIATRFIPKSQHLYPRTAPRHDACKSTTSIAPAQQSPAMADTPIKTDDTPHRRAGYKSWKKKYRKMRIKFERKMAEGENIFMRENRATATVKRLAEENEYEPFLLSIN